ncbi:MAG: AAA family ATPase [Patescibacteria group bacterium]
MKVIYLKIENFRGIKTAELFFSGHTLFVGNNNVGKSTICEALDLLLGPDRLSKPIDEYDFYNAKYLAEDGSAISISIEAVLIDLSEEFQSKFSNHLEFWNKVEGRLLGQEEIEATNNENVCPCLRLHFKANYDSEEDEFVAKTYYSHSPDEDDGKFTEVYRSQKREFGFLYLRALRTGSRALSLEKGTLLDVLLRLGEIRPHLWEDTRNTLLNLDPAIDASIDPLRSVLNNIEERISQYIPLDTREKRTRLFVSQLTREHLRKTLSFFMSTAPDQAPIPFQDLGTGTLSTLVFALLSAIAELKKDNVIFAMEEPEISIPPHTQRRIINYLLGNTSQSFVTSHSPYIIEKFEPEQIIILRRGDDAQMTGTSVTLASGMKAKNYQRKLRHSIAECLLGRAVIIGEGLVEQQVLSAASEIMEKNIANYPLDLSGVSIFDSGGDGTLQEYGAFFRSLGLKAYAFYDKKKRSNEEIQKITANFDYAKETDYKGIETLLTTEIPVDVQWQYLEIMSSSGLLTKGPTIPANKPTDKEIRSLTQQILVDHKGDSRGADLIKLCSENNLPNSVSEFLQKVYQDFPKPTEVQPVVFQPALVQVDLDLKGEETNF